MSPWGRAAFVTADGKVQGGLSLAGRLVASHVQWDPAKKLAVLLPVAGVSRMEIVNGSMVPAKSVQ